LNRDELHDVVLELVVPAVMKDNEAFGLYAAKLCKRFLSHWSKDSGCALFTSESLRGNKQFMMKAVAINPRCRAATAGDFLVEDFDLAVMAFSQKIVRYYDLFEGEDKRPADSGYEKERQYLHNLASKAREKVLLLEWYSLEFAPMFDYSPGNTPPPPPPGCRFPVLFQHDETGEALKKKILGYCGVPDEELVQDLRAASLHLLFMHPHDPLLLQGISSDVMPKLGRFFSCD
jgi:hypothetical protein